MVGITTTIGTIMVGITTVGGITGGAITIIGSITTVLCNLMDLERSQYLLMGE